MVCLSRKLNDCGNRMDNPFPHEMESVPQVNDLGEEIGRQFPPYDPYLPVSKDKNAKKRPYLSMDAINHPSEFSAAAELMEGTATKKTSGLSPVGSDDASVMDITSNQILNAQNSGNYDKTKY